MLKNLRRLLFGLRCWLIYKLAGEMTVGINLVVEDIYDDKTKPCFWRNVRVIQRTNHWLKMLLEKKSIWN